MPKKPKHKHSTPLEWGQVYHIYIRGVNRENIFIEERNYASFLQSYARHIEPIADTFAYCMLKNHFHVLVRIKNSTTKPPSQSFSSFFNAYARSINLAYGRTGSLFERPFGRIPVTSEAGFMNLVVYIHQNPQIHGLVEDFRSWPYSSFEMMLGEKTTLLKRDEVLRLFGGTHSLTAEHKGQSDLKKIAYLIGNDED